MALHTKLDVIRCHIRSAIQMIAVECHPSSVHTVVMACERLILDLSVARNVLIEWHYKLWIKDEHKREFEDAKNKAYNYFKHADTDPEIQYAGPKVDDLININEVQTLLNVQGYVKLSERNEPDFNFFAALMLIRHPHHFKPDFLEAHPELKEQLASLDTSRSSMLQVLRWMLLSADLLPNALLL